MFSKKVTKKYEFFVAFLENTNFNYGDFAKQMALNSDRICPITIQSGIIKATYLPIEFHMNGFHINSSFQTLI